MSCKDKIGKKFFFLIELKILKPIDKVEDGKKVEAKIVLGKFKEFYDVN